MGAVSRTPPGAEGAGIHADDCSAPCHPLRRALTVRRRLTYLLRCTGLGGSFVRHRKLVYAYFRTRMDRPSR